MVPGRIAMGVAAFPADARTAASGWRLCIRLDRVSG
jgi:hypothetical protein